MAPTDRARRCPKVRWIIYYPGLSHGLTGTHPELVNRDLLAFCQQGKRKVA
jgi:pimeloyl-ACP methyl ester carboxylesterase